MQACYVYWSQNRHQPQSDKQKHTNTQTHTVPNPSIFIMNDKLWVGKQMKSLKYRALSFSQLNTSFWVCTLMDVDVYYQTLKNVFMRTNLQRTRRLAGILLGYFMSVSRLGNNGNGCSRNAQKHFQPDTVSTNYWMSRENQSTNVAFRTSVQ